MSLASILLGIFAFILVASIAFGIHSLIFLIVFNDWFGPG